MSPRISELCGSTRILSQRALNIDQKIISPVRKFYHDEENEDVANTMCRFLESNGLEWGRAYQQSVESALVMIGGWGSTRL